MDNYVSENNRVRVMGAYDVIVVGGGMAGVSAALAARRNGCSVLLVEKSVMLGGLATLGLVVLYNAPLCDWNGRKLVGGIPEELLHLSIKYGYSTLPEEWKFGVKKINSTKKYTTVFSPASFVVALDELMEKEGVDILFDTLFCNSMMADGICKGVIVENKAGRQYYAAKVMVDATGDADVMLRSGAACMEDDNWLSYWALSTSLNAIRESLECNNIIKAIKIETFGAKANGENAPIGSKKYNITNAFEISKFIMEGRKLLRKKMQEMNKREESVVTIPGMPQFRTTRRIEGLYLLTEKDRNIHFEDSIGCAAEELAAHDIIEIPFRTLISKDVKNIIAAGRIISSTGAVRNLTRLISPASITGQAAGIAAAIAARNGCNVHNIKIEELQKRLCDAGANIHF